jgi:uncharacterized protein with HEPN domain
MSLNDKDLNIINHIIDYCEEIKNTVARFGNSYENFSTDSVYRNSCALCILQIGELSGKLSDAFKKKYNKVPWKQIKAMRNIVAHSYGSIETETTWEIITDDIPVLKCYCNGILAQSNYVTDT